MLCRRTHDATHRRTPLAQPPDQIEALICGDSAGNDQQYPPVLKQIDPPTSSVVTNMLPPEDKGDSDRDQRRRDEPHRDEQDCQMAGALGSLGSQCFGVHNDPFARPVSEQRFEAADEPRHPVDHLGDRLEALLQPCLWAAVLTHPRFDQRPSEYPDIDLGFETASQPLDLHHRFLEQQKLWLGLHLELLSNLEELSEKASERDLLQRSAEDRLADGPAGLGEGVDRSARRHVTCGEMHFRYPPVIAREKAQQHISKIKAGRAVEPTHDAEIDNADCSRGVDKHVSGVKIGMKKTIAEDLVEKGASCLVQQIVDTVTDRDECRAIIDADTGDTFQCQHAPTGAPPIDLRHPEIRVASKILSELRSRGRLKAQVHLELNDLS